MSPTASSAATLAAKRGRRVATVQPTDRLEQRPRVPKQHAEFLVRRLDVEQFPAPAPFGDRPA